MNFRAPYRGTRVNSNNTISGTIGSRPLRLLYQLHSSRRLETLFRYPPLFTRNGGRPVCYQFSSRTDSRLVKITPVMEYSIAKL